MSDLLEKITWLRGHDEHAWQIGENARRLAFSMTVKRETSRAIPTIRKALWPSAVGGSGGSGFSGTRKAKGDDKRDTNMRRFDELDNAVLEQETFRARVLDLEDKEQAVRLHLGPGPAPREGFINVDKFKNSQTREFFERHPQDYIVYPFAELPWPIADCSVDYIYHEDFIEHIPQKNQFLVLAEALRVSEAGCDTSRKHPLPNPINEDAVGLRTRICWGSCIRMGTMGACCTSVSRIPGGDGVTRGLQACLLHGKEPKYVTVRFR